MESYLLYMSVGVFAGFSAGLLGVGGGLVVVPVLLMIYQSQGLAPDHLAHLAVGTSLASIVFTSISSLLAHHHRGAVAGRGCGPHRAKRPSTHVTKEHP